MRFWGAGGGVIRGKHQEYKGIVTSFGAGFRVWDVMTMLEGAYQ